MNKRNLIFIGALAISYLMMVAYLSYHYPEQVNILMQATFGIILVGAAVIGILISKGSSKKKGIFRVFKVLFASYALAFAMWMLGSVLLLPLLGYKGFESVGTPIFTYLLLGLMILVSPFVARKLS